MTSAGSPSAPLLARITVRALRAGIMCRRGEIKTSHDESLAIPSRDAGRTIKAHLYSTKKSIAGPTPVLVNFHGSGFILPFHGTDDAFCRRVVADTPFAVIDASYRLGPEHMHPADLEDVIDVVKWVQSQSERFDSNHIALSGFSAGGNLVLAAAVTAFEPATFCHIVAVYPVIDLKTDPAQRQAPEKGGEPIPTWVARTFDACHLPAGIDLASSAVSPAFADPKLFPKKLTFITCGYDTLAFPVEDLAQRLQASKDVVLKRLDSVNHAWDKQPWPEDSHEARAVEEEHSLIVARLNESLSATETLK